MRLEARKFITLTQGSEQARTDTSWLLDGEYEYRMNRLRTTGTPLVSQAQMFSPIY